MVNKPLTHILDTDLKLAAIRDGFGHGLLKLGAVNEQVVVLTADVAESTRVLEFAKRFPKRFFECGVAEQNMMGIAAGLALSGKIPFVCSYAVFSPGRSWDQLRVSVCYSRANVKIAGHHTGITVGADGASHQALEDIAITRVLPNLVVVVPADALEAEKAVIAAANINGPVYLRLTREKTPLFTKAIARFKIGQAEVLKAGADCVIVACGPLVYQSLQAAYELEKEGVSVMVVNNHTIKPLDEKTLITAAAHTGCVVTVEEHQLAGGAGSAVAELLVMEFVGIPDTFGESGQPSALLAKYGLTVDHIKQKVKRAIKRKNGRS